MTSELKRAIAELEAINQKAITDAGPRYTPGVDPSAPNIAIPHLTEAFDALALGDRPYPRLREFAHALDSTLEYRASLVNRVFARRRLTPQRLVQALRDFPEDCPPAVARSSVIALRHTCSSVVQHLETATETLRADRRALGEGSSEEVRRRLEQESQDLSRIAFAVRDIQEYIDGPAGQLLAGKTAVLLLGEWGTGKTHYLCDIALQRTSAGKPALLVLASSLSPGIHPLDAAAAATKFAASGHEMLERLESLGAATNSRALLVFDAINEADPNVWRRQLAGIASQVAKYQHVALVVSCRRPFDEALVTKDARRRFVSLDHYGFQDEEFNAQLEYFAYYEIPAPSVPLITPEFTRPLFLKILCQSMKHLSKRAQRQKLRDVASGQKGMTYVLEAYIKQIGAPIEQDFGLPTLSCWKAMKGERTGQGLAGAMAAARTDWLTVDATVACLQQSLGIASGQAEALLQRLVHDGLLARSVRWPAGEAQPVIEFSYQRFSDHIIARHLLQAHLKTDSEQAVRRCFYANRPLGAPFQLDQWSNRFAMPGIVAAIMIEFPERMKRSGLPRELINYLPRNRRYIQPLKDVFLDGLYWRASHSFTTDTDRVVSFLLTRVDDWTRYETLEVLVGLATRPNHPYSADRLARYLQHMTMAEQDAFWSEFLRRLDEHANVFRVLAWVEKTPEADPDAIRNEIRLLSRLLTTTQRALRDRVTRALVLRGCNDPSSLFAETLSSLSANDPYIPERMLAAAYGTCMRLWADPGGDHLRRAIVPFARQLVRKMFLPAAPHATKHVLSRDYALGVIALARQVDPNAIATRHMAFLRGNFNQIASPFVDASSFGDDEVSEGLSVMHMDFENYTIGRLIPGRQNYDSSHTEYQAVRRQIARRIEDLGYSEALFGQIDQRIAEYRYMSSSRDGAQTDRYGKKYSWIAYFEMYGTRLDQGNLDDEETRDRPSDCDLDPSFPVAPPEWAPPLNDPFANAPSDPGGWLANGPLPEYGSLLSTDTVGSTHGPWVALDGFIQEEGSHDREIFTFIRGLFLRSSDVEKLRTELGSLDYLGNGRIPEGGEDYYTYAGEVPWSPRYGSSLRRKDGHARRYVAPGPYYWRPKVGWRGAVRLEVPVHRWSWESYHSDLNQVSGLVFPAPALCEALGLLAHEPGSDLWCQDGRPGSLYRKLRGASVSSAHMAYLRQDLLESYLDRTDQVLIWVLWGERRLHHKSAARESAEVRSAYQNHYCNFQYVREYKS